MKHLMINNMSIETPHDPNDIIFVLYQAYKDVLLKLHDTLRQQKKMRGTALVYDELARKHVAGQVRCNAPGGYIIH